jgi:hypothetical protein
MLTILALLIVGAIAALLIAAALRPDTFEVERTASIRASAAQIHPLINDMAQMNSWNPFIRKDPDIQGHYRGPAAGPGAAYDFEGNREVGSGSVEITASTPERITMKLDMREPMEGHNIVEFRLAPRGDATDVTWAMHGPNTYMSKLMGLVFNMDRMIGGAFEAGLADLKALAERRA